MGQQRSPRSSLRLRGPPRAMASGLIVESWNDYPHHRNRKLWPRQIDHHDLPAADPRHGIELERDILLEGFELEAWGGCERRRSRPHRLFAPDPHISDVAPRRIPRAQQVVARAGNDGQAALRGLGECTEERNVPRWMTAES